MLHFCLSKMNTIKEIQHPPHFRLITSDQTLFEICQLAQQKSAVALDTEFVRTRTLYPHLGLIQLYDGEHLSLIDPIQIQDFSPFVQLLANQQVIKVLHACSEDLEVFQYHFQQLPRPIFDTQIAGQFLNFGNSVGLASLIQHYFQLNLDKGASRTDWLARPLTEQQLYYAAADVWYLYPLYQQIIDALKQTRWQSAVENDCEMLLSKRSKVKSLDKAYVQIPNAWKLAPNELATLKLLAKWRQEEAAKRDLALNFVVKAEHLYLIAKHSPKHKSELIAMGLLEQEVRIHGKKLLQIVEQAKKLDEKDYPPSIQRISEDPRYRKLIKMLQNKLAEITPEDLATEVIASKRDLEALIKWVWLKKQDPIKQPDLLQGWRQEFGVKLLNIITELT